MLDFHKYLMRHGESWIQEIVEKIERSEGIRHEAPLSLQDRWDIVMQPAEFQQRAA